MATIQQLDRLHGIKRSFLEENTLESAVLCQRIDKIIERTEQMLQQRAFLREERRKLRSASEYLEAANKSVSLIKRKDWLPFPEANNASASIAPPTPVSGIPPASSSSSSSSSAVAAVVGRCGPDTVRINMSGLVSNCSSRNCSSCC